MAVKEKNKSETTSITEIENDAILKETQHVKRCFIITPIGSDDELIRRHIDGVYNATLQPVLSEFGYESNLPHKILTPGSITRQIVESIFDSDLIIANLTGINPNVMYELALAHCFNKPLIIIAEKGTVLPFDIIHERTLFYDYDPEGVFELKSDLRSALQELNEIDAFKSTVVSYIREYSFDNIISDSKIINDSKEDYSKEILSALRRFSTHLDRIESGVNKNIGEDNSLSFVSVSYRIYKSDTAETIDFENQIREIIEYFRNRSIIVRCRFYDGFCTLLFTNHSYGLQRRIESDMRVLCDKFNLIYERIEKRY